MKQSVWCLPIKQQVNAMCLRLGTKLLPEQFQYCIPVISAKNVPLYYSYHYWLPKTFTKLSFRIALIETHKRDRELKRTRCVVTQWMPLQAAKI